MLVKTRTSALALAAALTLLGAACSEDDGGSVRDVTPDDSSGSGSSASGSGSSASGSSASGSSASGSSASGSGASEAACETVGDPSSTASTITVTLDEFTITTDGEAVAGEVAIEAVNAGEEPHEVVVVAGVAPADLPIVDGQVDEDALPEGALIGEIEAFPAGETCSGAFELEAGDYTLFCNLLETEEDGTVESHVEEGMVASITVG